MKKGWYLHFNARDTIGASNKISEQLRMLSCYYEVKELDVQMKKKGYLANFSALLPYGSLTWDYNKVYRESAPDFIYVRKSLTDRKFYKFCKYIKKIKPECIIISEIHTWPYYGTSIKFPYVIIAIKDYFYNMLFMYKFIDRYVTYSDDKILFRVPTIILKNGISLDRIEPRNPIRIVSLRHSNKNGKEETVNLLSVATYGIHHGIERLIKGLAEYYKDGGEEDFRLHLVGYGDEIKQYEKLTNDLNLKSHVFFYGRLEGRELNRIYDIADIGISTFGWYKVGVYKSSALKVREYLAKGLPIISGCREDAFDGVDTDFYLEFPNDESIIDFNAVSSFFHKLYDNTCANDVVSRIRLFAEEHVSMDVAMKPVVEYLKTELDMKKGL